MGLEHVQNRGRLFKVQRYTDIIKSLTYRKPLEQLFRGLFVFGGGFVQNTIKEEEAYYNKYERDPSTYKHYGRLWKRIRAQDILFARNVRRLAGAPA